MLGVSRPQGQERSLPSPVSTVHGGLGPTGTWDPPLPQPAASPPGGGQAAIPEERRILLQNRDARQEGATGRGTTWPPAHWAPPSETEPLRGSNTHGRGSWAGLPRGQESGKDRPCLLPCCKPARLSPVDHGQGGLSPHRGVAAPEPGEGTCLQGPACCSEPGSWAGHLPGDDRARPCPQSLSLSLLSTPPPPTQALARRALCAGDGEGRGGRPDGASRCPRAPCAPPSAEGRWELGALVLRGHQ